MTTASTDEIYMTAEKLARARRLIDSTIKQCIMEALPAIGSSEDSGDFGRALGDLGENLKNSIGNLRSARA